ncbi:MAG: glycosyltransferase [candidate division Zixibacteria bacterium]|nr:glycosyltransferase [candidate division Zixibacteria bacterium]
MPTSIIIPSDRPNDLRNCLQSLRKQTLAFEGPIIIVAWGKQRQEISAIGREFNVDTLETPTCQTGIAESRNLAINKVANKNWDFILILDDDTILHKEWHRSMQQACQNNPAYDLFASITLYSCDPNVIQSAGHILEKASLLDLYYKTVYTSDKNYKDPLVPCHNCALIRRKVIDKIRSIDDDVYDTRFHRATCFDFGLKAIILGFKTKLANEAIAYHAGYLCRKDLNDEDVLSQLTNRCLLYLKYYPELDRNRAFRLLRGKVKTEWYEKGYHNARKIKGAEIEIVYKKALAEANKLWTRNRDLRWIEMVEKLDKAGREKLLFGNWQA